jgi:cation diffusion facilitator family transporter
MNYRQGSIEDRVINIGLTANILLALLKTTFGILGHSEALLADGINSTSDVAYYLVVKVFMWFARRPPDREHPYGHRQLESIAALAVGSFVITTAIALFWGAVNDVYDIIRAGEADSRVSLAALEVALVTVAVKLVLTFYTRRVATQGGNAAVLALARDHRNDVFSAAGAAVGILASRGGYPWGDPLMGALVALIVLLTGIQILRESSADLMDAVPAEALERQVHSVLLGLPGVMSVEEVQAHRFGPYLTLNVTIGVDGTISVRDGDRVASEVERLLCSRISLAKRVYVHYHPTGASTVRRSSPSGSPP